ncbi:MAG TPA: sugar-binding protein, partial [Rectinemataceae bacterium]|nr:sugar-binding protein [Rectinemataceae bacterium]
MKKCLFILLALVVAASLFGQNLIGVAMPTQSLQRWNQDGANMKAKLEAKGFKVDLQYANNDINTQIQQLENMVTKGAKVLVIASIDGSVLSDVLKKAHQGGIKVIAYDRLIMNTPDVDYYATFDNFKVGAIQGKYIEGALGLNKGKGPYNIELFAGSPDDNNATFFFNGAMSVIKPYLDSKKLVIPTGQKDFTVIAIQSWESAKAQARMDNLIAA